MLPIPDEFSFLTSGFAQCISVFIVFLILFTYLPILGSGGVFFLMKY
ncbi:hypothetical protein CRD_02777 [Raphidiopsis brookii D9]|nr:hypothetical protein CRD_02777 [Raphidiopsis brookii D9]